MISFREGMYIALQHSLKLKLPGAGDDSTPMRHAACTGKALSML
jgi:hypothetical protein